MANLADGDYYIINQSNHSLYLDVTNGNRKNGANVQVWTKNTTDAQVFQVTTRSDGSRQISSRFTGKCIDVVSDTTGGNVQMWTDNDDRSQAWDIIDLEQTTTVEGQTVSLYKVELTASTASPKRCMELFGNSGFDSGTNVCIAGYGGASDQKWAFLPVPRLQSGGVYELLLNLDKRYALDVHSYSKVNGAQLILAGRHGGNNQKFYLHNRTGDKWTIRNINSGRYLQVSNGTAEDTTPVTQWADAALNEPTADRWQWKPVSFGTVEMGGIEREVIKLYSWVTNDANTFVMDANQHVNLNLSNITIVHTDPDGEGQYSQEWVLVPTYATDETMPIPHGLGWATSSTSYDIQRIHESAETLYPAWYCPNAWATSGPNHYEWRFARKYMDKLGRWVREYPIEQAGWETANVTIKDHAAWVTEGLPADFDETKYKAIAYDVQVRCVGVGETEAVVGKEAAVELRAYKEPNVTISNAGFSPEGLRFDYTSDYEGGTTDINIRSITRNGKRVTGYNWYQSSQGLDESGSILVPISDLTAWLNENDEITIRWTCGTDELPEFDHDHYTTLTVAYDTGHGATLTPVVTNAEGRTLSVELSPHYTYERVWYRSESDGMVELEKRDGKFYVEYPFGEDIEIWVTGKSRDGDTWGVWNETYDSSMVGGARPCHAWNWDGGSFLLELREDEPLETDISVESDTEVVKLNRRPWESVLLGATSSGKLRAEGEFSTKHFPEIEATRQKLEELRLQGHVRYRSPHGLRCDVCVTGYSLTCQRSVWHVSIDMVREAV